MIMWFTAWVMGVAADALAHTDAFGAGLQVEWFLGELMAGLLDEPTDVVYRRRYRSARPLDTASSAAASDG